MFGGKRRVTYTKKGYPREVLGKVVYGLRQAGKFINHELMKDPYVMEAHGTDRTKRKIDVLAQLVSSGVVTPREGKYLEDKYLVGNFNIVNNIERGKITPCSANVNHHYLGYQPKAPQDFPPFQPPVALTNADFYTIPDDNHVYSVTRGTQSYASAPKRKYLRNTTKRTDPEFRPQEQIYTYEPQGVQHGNDIFATAYPPQQFIEEPGQFPVNTPLPPPPTPLPPPLPPVLSPEEEQYYYGNADFYQSALPPYLEHQNLQIPPNPPINYNQVFDLNPEVQHLPDYGNTNQYGVPTDLYQPQFYPQPGDQMYSQDFPLYNNDPYLGTPVNLYELPLAEQQRLEEYPGYQSYGTGAGRRKRRKTKKSKVGGRRRRKNGRFY
jgi:hypothetical protein